ncbi:unnamed protein product [Heterosigma akashiwo]|eukprot:CAMPEP_0194561252 /NCGR_PEP_ID=MMETSP0292-20121207/2113_1 /TAXON_ID=39354 /ORGANISM="Heterosigma akashiwo, Strain CCMP2393" /LENGTH=123 /DNA_ID=CAMNT_0039409607 /DNA_START=118 /DNA_END=489 /DNA_ORIENTATION=-
MKCFAFLVLCLIGMAAAFQAPSRFQSAVTKPVAPLKMAEDMSWEGKAPPSKVLGPFLSNLPSGILGPVSLAMLAAGTYCVHESNILNVLNAETVYPQYVLGSLLCPISWGTHVAAWIQKQNGK